MAKDSRRVAVSGLRTQCSRRGRLWRHMANVAQASASALTFGEIAFEKQDTSNQAIINAGHFSHSGSFARIYRWTQQSRDRTLARNFGRGVVGSLDTLSGGSRSRRNGARPSAGAYQHFHWGRKYPIYRWTRESYL